MSEPTDTSGVNPSPSGNSGGDDDSSKSSEALEKHAQKLLDEKRKATERAKAAEQELALLRQKEREREDQELEKQKNFEALLKKQKEETAAERAKREALENQVVEAIKSNAFRKVLGAQVDDKYKSTIDLSKIAIDPETGEVDQMSVAQYVEDYRKTYPEIIKVPGQNRMQSNEPKGEPSRKMSHAEWVAMKPGPEKWAAVKEGRVTLPK